MNPSYGIILWIIIGAIAGWVASLIVKTNVRQGLVMDIIVGVIGALIGGFITRSVFHNNTGNNGLLASFGVALLGSIILLAIVRAVTGGRGRPIAH
jgi:uncharacterized membrane protein YeaQ/YmgE (transglycosylase-associated protein family)